MKTNIKISTLNIPSSAKLIYMLLTVNANRKGEIAISVNTIARKLGLGASTVRRNIKRLHKEGLIYICPQYESNGMRAVNIYYVKNI